MCRWIAYAGKPVRLEDLITRPSRSLVHQSLYARQSNTVTNGDGFGVGWYGDRDTPGVYREISPAWSDENLQSLCAQLSSGCFFAHVRAATVGGTSRVNCHPFASGRWLFMHNGQIGGFAGIRRRVEAMIPDRFYPERRGATDSEAIFLIALGLIEAHGPIEAVRRALDAVIGEMTAAGIHEPLRFSAALSDGAQTHVFRWSSDALAPSVYYRQGCDGLAIVSEPIDDNPDGWLGLESGQVLSCDRHRAGASPVLAPFVAGRQGLSASKQPTGSTRAMATAGR
ncbi:MAG: class II glutamine amidotransferase [Burkholderiaceae bacterium]|nr:class II glutamine amidotransferase [Burkholderiaceae bacterium]